MKYLLVAAVAAFVTIAPAWALPTDPSYHKIKFVAQDSKKLVVGKLAKIKHGIRNTKVSESPVTVYVFRNVDIIKKTEERSKNKFKMKINTGYYANDRESVLDHLLQADEAATDQDEYSSGENLDGSTESTDFVYDTDALATELATQDLSPELRFVAGLPNFRKDRKYVLFIPTRKNRTLSGVTGNQQGVFQVDDNDYVYTYTGVPVLDIKNGRLILSQPQPDFTQVAESFIAHSNISSHRIVQASNAPMVYTNQSPIKLRKFVRKTRKWLAR
jgi:hypothetical protein